MKYDHKQVEKKWQDIWDEAHCFEAENGSDKEKFYALVEFPYPSGQGLHVGHPRSYTALDIVARKKRMQGYNVLYPMGWDAFGLPTENYAIKNHVHPAEVTKNNIARFKGQLRALGLSFDWSREINTTDPNYYKWTQWIFLQLFKKGLAYKKEMSVNWCTSCKCVLANEEVVNGVCERCGSEVVHKTKSQWMLAITKYAQRLIDDLDDVDFIDRVKVQQKNWIGRSTGAEVDFKTTEGDTLTVYTTRPDTLFGATYMVISPEHPAVEKWAGKLANIDEIHAYREEAARKSDFERTELNKDKTGVKLDGVAAVNPVNGREIPIFVSDYVLMGYGTGAIMAVPAHDDRDWEFAKKFGCEIIEVVSGGENVQKAAFTAKDETGILVNSEFLNGKTVKDAIPAMIAWLEEKGIGRAKVQYKLRDWVFSRQRYWGEPIPLVHCDKCGWVAIPEEQLPLELPNVHTYEPTDNGESPLAHMTDWVNTTCPCCGGPAKRETDTMPQWAGSSWYFLRYMDPHNDKALASKEALEYWSPVDWYNGGMEHTTLHLLYSRFWHKFLYDIGVVPTKEPYAKRTSHGMILGENGEKMSKSRGNVVNPDEIVETYGADTMRLYEMFIGDFEKAAPWSPKSIKGCRRFLERVWALVEKVQEGDAYSKQHEVLMHRTINKVGDDADNLKANTAIAALMTMLNEFYDKGVNKAEYMTFLTLLNPFAPHITEELWQQMGGKGLLSIAPWPQYDEAKTVEDTVEMAVQVNGKLKCTIKLPVDCDKQAAIDAALAEEKVQHAVEGKQMVKQIVVPGKIVNLVVR
ncbi:leucine--tRNA ligase [Agathobaculum sp. NSJ-28]|uniref:Leucine--tRNA ligase n=2 Tax=Agathobaculum TaxID=2048137 RepID=A0A923LUN4_9FIRM|nr:MULTISPECIES: leucine--tRNA ligase [Butyricicoccaceae]MBC5724998.1 leucine--tRNA ligase [Agathobaculum faecis]MCU6788443.1 leucine--tRNA ligase [Agathobaculum ammoniilyticum]WOC76512.1 leucine--tRNA ligase [Intestinibacillus sp. NTUH-41-i26]SCI74012.1 Leucine--tRNA ligase [uncultured Butyricicoccus sp.]